jgi:hypothetical protein
LSQEVKDSKIPNENEKIYEKERNGVVVIGDQGAGRDRVGGLAAL